MAAVAGPEIINPGLISYLDAGNTRSYSGTGTAWSDLSGLSNSTTLVNSPTFSASNGGTMVFNGVDQLSIYPVNFISFPGIGTFTLSMWFRTSQTNGGPMFGQQNTTDPSAASGFVPVIYMRSDGLIRIEPFWTGNVANNIVSTTVANNNRWYNVTTTFSAGINNLYVNGVFESQRTGLTLTSFTTTYYYMIGAGRSNLRGLGTNYFNGEISVFSFYNRALSQQEIQQNFNALRGRYGV